MPDLFGAGIRAKLAAAMGQKMLPATLLKTTPGTYGVDPTAGNNPTTTSYSCRGFYEVRHVFTGGGVDLGAQPVREAIRVITILGGTLPSEDVFPQPGDRITMDGVTSTIRDQGVTVDPVAATYTCQCMSDR